MPHQIELYQERTAFKLVAIVTTWECGVDMVLMSASVRDIGRNEEDQNVPFLMHLKAWSIIKYIFESWPNTRRYPQSQVTQI